MPHRIFAYVLKSTGFASLRWLLVWVTLLLIHRESVRYVCHIGQHLAQHLLCDYISQTSFSADVAAQASADTATGVAADAGCMTKQTAADKLTIVGSTQKTDRFWQHTSD